MPDEPHRELDLGPLELWALGRVAAVMPKYDPAWPEALREAWRRRLMANLTGVCECGGAMSAVGAAGSVTHVGGCPASDEILRPMLEARR